MRIGRGGGRRKSEDKRMCSDPLQKTDHLTVSPEAWLKLLQNIRDFGKRKEGE